MKARIAALVVLCCLGNLAFSATQTLTINTNGNGAVARNPNSGTYPNGAVVTLTATPAGGWQFGSWSGDITGVMNPTNVLMDSDKVITANFLAIPIYSLTVGVAGSGTVAPSSGSYLSNTVVAVSATPSNGWIFFRWNGDASGNVNPLSVTMNSNKVISAEFGQPPTITNDVPDVAANGGDTVSFSVGVQGSQPLSYRWEFNNGPISTATGPTLSLTNVSLAEAGGYRVFITNSYGSVTSRLATLTVQCLGTNTVSVCTDTALRQAVAIGGHVRFCCNGTIVLTNTINVTTDVTLDAVGRSVMISGNNAVRLFNVSSGISLTASNLVLANGLHLGTNGANALNAMGATAAQNGQSATGGAILNSGGLVRLVSCVLSNNLAQGGAGGAGNTFAANGNGGSGAGGAIYNLAGNVILQNVLGVNNNARGAIGGFYNISFLGDIYGDGGSGTGGAIHNNAGSISIQNSIFTSNSVYAAVTGPNVTRPFASGGVLFQSGGNCDISDSTFSSNRAVGASSTGLGSTSFNNAANARGGAIAAMSGTTTIRHVGFQSNQALGGATFRFSGVGEVFGGAVFNSAEMKLSEADLSNNVAQPGYGGDGRGPASGWGGGIYNLAMLELTRSTVAGNVVYGSAGGCSGPGGSSGTPGFGGGLCNLSTASFRSTNCTFTMNSAVGGAPCNSGVSAGGAYGGGIYNESATVLMVNVTVASNSVSVTSGSYQGGPAAGANIANTNGSVTLQASLIAYPGNNANIYGTVVDGGYNISSDSSANFSSGTSFNFTDPKLLPLANNGGPTFTMALASNSPAIDWAPIGGASTTDQRGLMRPVGSGIDLGAFEFGAALPPLSTQRNGVMLNIWFSGQAGVNYWIQRSTNLFSWEIMESTGAMSTNGTILRSYPTVLPLGFYRLTLDPY